MAWDTDFALEGFFMFGPPLNVHRWILDTGQFGYSTDVTWVAHFLLDDDKDLEGRLDGMLRRDRIEYYPTIRLLGRSSASVGPGWYERQIFHRVYLTSLTRDFGGIRSPFTRWDGPTLGLAFDRKDNPGVHAPGGGW